MPIDPAVADLCDKGEIEKVNSDYLADASLYIEKSLTLNRAGHSATLNCSPCNLEENNYMKIAIATEGTNVSGHFGKCENFTIAEIENSNLISKVVVNTMGNQHGLLPTFLA